MQELSLSTMSMVSWQFVVFAALGLLPILLVKRFPQLGKFLPIVVVWMVMGPVIGTVYPDLFEGLSIKVFKFIGFIGLQIFGVAIGTHIKPGVIFKREKSTIFLGFTSFIIAFGLGFVATGELFDRYPDIFGGRSRFLMQSIGGILTGVTALPVLSAILTLLGLAETKLGQRNIAMATLHDIILWPAVGAICTAGNIAKSGSEFNLTTNRNRLVSGAKKGG